MSDETTLLPCPFCGGEIPAPTRRYMSVLICQTCNAYGPGNSDMTNDELIAAWNTRAYLNPDGLPMGLTISDDGNLLNWRGENYVKQGMLGNGTLTAEQVMAIAWRHQPDYCSDTHVCFDWQAIADELNAKLGSGTCEWQLEHSGTLYDKWRCSKCGYLFVEPRTDQGYTDLEPNYCPNCGAKVVG